MALQLRVTGRQRGQGGEVAACERPPIAMRSASSPNPGAFADAATALQPSRRGRRRVPHRRIGRLWRAAPTGRTFHGHPDTQVLTAADPAVRMRRS